MNISHDAVWPSFHQQGLIHLQMVSYSTHIWHPCRLGPYQFGLFESERKWI
jgi:hypothetical protein